MNKNILLIASSILIVACSTHEEKVEKERISGKEIVEEKSGLIKGIGEGLTGAGKDAMSSLSEGVGSVIKGAEHGFDKSLTKVNVKEDATVSAYGLKIGKCGKYFSDSLLTNIVSIYIVFEKDFKSELLIKAIDNENLETGRVRKKISGKEGDAKFVDFVFDKKIKIDLVKEFELIVGLNKK